MLRIPAHLVRYSDYLRRSGSEVFRYWTSKLEASEQSDSERLKELRRLIDNEIGVPYANELSQCRLIGIGSDPCRYRQKFLAYSTAKTSEFKLNQLVTQYHQGSGEPIQPG